MPLPPPHDEAAGLLLHAVDQLTMRGAEPPPIHVFGGNTAGLFEHINGWQGEIEDEPEAYVILHTRAEHVAEIIRQTNESHPYDTVHVLATDVSAADPRYLGWVLEETRFAREDG